MTHRPLILNVNLQGFGQRPASWRTQDVEGTELTTPDFWAHLGRVAERGRLDAVFFADRPQLGNPNQRPLGQVEPFIALQAIGEATEHLGLVGSASTTYNDPYDLAERLLSLDVLTGGRLAWNAVTTYATGVSKNFGIEANPDRPTRYRRAKEFTQVVRELWNSAETGTRIRHRGEFFTVDGALNVPPSKQGHPVIFQAGGSAGGRDLAASSAEGVFSVELLLESAIENYRAVKSAAQRYGRNPADVKITPGLSFVLGSTEEEAKRRYDESEALAPDDLTLNTLADYLGEEIKSVDPESPIPDRILDREIDERTYHRSVSYQRGIVRWIRQKHRDATLRDVLRDFGGYGARILVGTPEQVADSIEEWYVAGAADGFNLMADEFPRGLETFVDEVVPILQKRGLVDREYEESTLRGRLRTKGHLGAGGPTDHTGSVHSASAGARSTASADGAAEADERELGAGFATRQIHAGQEPEGAHRARITPVYLTAGFVFDDFADAEARFAGAGEGYVYSRLDNPTNIAVEAKLAALENGRNALLVSSGQAATFVATAGILQAGDHVLSAPSIYEGTRAIFRDNYARFGIEVEFVENPNDLGEWRRKVRGNTKLFFGEAIPNPKNDLIDLAGIADAAHEAGVPFIVDSTIATPYLLRPLDHGADVVVHSASKFLSGQGSVIGGAIIDAGRFDYSAQPDRFPQLAQSVRGASGPSYTEKFGSRAYHVAVKKQIASRFGTSLSPFNAFLLQQGLETLSVRVRRQTDSALEIARWLESRPEVESVDYSGLESSPHHDLARRYLPRGQGAVFAFTLVGGREAAQGLIDSVQLITRMTHIGDVRTLILNPATTTHSALSAEERRRAGIGDGLVRLSVGLEDPDDLIDDLESAILGTAG